MPPKDPEERRAYMKAWYEKNRESQIEKSKQRYEELTDEEREARREYSRQHYRKNREKVLARQRELAAADPEYRRKKAEASRRYAKEHPEKVRHRQRQYWAKSKYGLSIEEVDEILARGCAICGTHEGRTTGRRGAVPGTPGQRLCLDHDHKNGKVRDALCHSCNSGLGLFQDDPARLRAAADYLESH